MGDLKLTSASGSVTLSPENVAGTTTITLPSSTATLATNENFTSTGIDDNATSTAITIDSSENVGIGVTPESWQSTRKALQVGDSTAVWGDIYKNSWFSNNVYRNTSGTESYINSSPAQQVYMNNGGIMYFQTASSGTADNAITWTTAMTINNSGNVYINSSGIGGAKFVAEADSTTENPAAIHNTRTGTSSEYSVLLYRNSSLVGSIQTTNTATSYNTSSDYRLKENVVPMTGSIDRVKALKPSRFNFITDPDTTVDGFLAHEAQEVVPEAISGEKDAMMMEEYEVTPAVKDENDNIVTEAVMGTREVPDMQGIDQAKLVPLLVGAIQEQQTLIESLQADIAILKGATI